MPIGAGWRACLEASAKSSTSVGLLQVAVNAGWWDRRYMGRRMRIGGLLVPALLLLAGCGSSVVTKQAAVTRAARPSITAAQRCAAAARLSPGVVLPGWHMGAVQFLSTASGVGITAPYFPCYHRSKSGAQVGSQTQPVRLAVTSDGGRSWQVTGATLPVGRMAGGVSPEQMTATSSGDLWALVGKGRLVATHDAGSSWQVQAIPDPVEAITMQKRVVWAVSCARAAGGGCRAELWRSSSANGAWSRIALPRLIVQNLGMPHLAVTADNRTIALYEPSDQTYGELLISRDGGLHWTQRRTPTWEHNSCDIGAALIASGPRTLWLLCLGDAAAGISTKGLLRSTDAGRTWSTVSAVTTLLGSPTRGSLPREEPSALAGGSRTRLWLSLTNGLAESNDGGQYWTYRWVVNPYGWSTTLNVLDANHAWLLAAGAGLWHTTDGVHWHAIGPLNTK
jgi:hypothetical protein